MTLDALPEEAGAHYIWRQTQRKSTRTIYYVGILAGSRDDAALIDKALQAFLQ